MDDECEVQVLKDEIEKLKVHNFKLIDTGYFLMESGRDLMNENIKLAQELADIKRAVRLEGGDVKR